MTKLTNDPRHMNILRIVDAPIEERGFADWSMQPFNLQDHTTITADRLNTLQSVYTDYMTLEPKILLDFYREALEPA